MDLRSELDFVLLWKLPPEAGASAPPAAGVPNGAVIAGQIMASGRSPPLLGSLVPAARRVTPGEHDRVSVDLRVLQLR